MRSKKNYEISTITLMIVIAMSLMCCRGSKEKTESKLPAESQPVMPYFDPATEEESPGYQVTDSTIRYDGAAEDEIRKSLSTFEPIVPVLASAEQTLHIVDSLRYDNADNDSIVLRPLLAQTHSIILDYKRRMKNGIVMTDRCPSLLDLSRVKQPGDSTERVLPPAAPSTFFSKQPFFFFGGAPFIRKYSNEENVESQVDGHGNFEARFISDNTENGNFFLNYVYHQGNFPTEILFGPPLSTYDSGPHDINGIGSLIHKFEKRIPAFFVTPQGLVPARVISVEIKLVPEDLGCVPDQPRIMFGCSQDINDQDILAIYIPFSATTLTAGGMKEHGSVWSADLNNDGVADVACIVSVSAGEISRDKIIECIWFINTDGQWQIIDWAEELDCT